MLSFNLVLLSLIGAAFSQDLILSRGTASEPATTSTYIGTNWGIDWSPSIPTYRPSAEALAATHALEIKQKAELEAAALAAMPSYNTSKYARMGRAKRSPKKISR